MKGEANLVLARRLNPSARVAAVAIAAVLSCAVVWSKRDSVLSGLADAWVVSEEPAAADAVVVFGGGLDTRPFAAADYYRGGLAKTILLANVRRSPSETLGVLRPHTDLNRDVLVKLGVAQQSIVPFGKDLSSTREEANALRQTVDRMHLKTVLVPTEVFSSRRVQWAMLRAFEGTDVRIIVQAIDPWEYTRHDWWRHEQGLIAFQNEVIKHLYYRLKH